MKSRSFVVYTLWLTCAMFGCGEDSGQSAKPDATCLPENCASGVCREDGTCAEVQKQQENEPCDGLELVCDDGLECMDGTCFPENAPTPEMECSTDKLCPENEGCLEGQCVPIEYLQDGEACEASSEVKICDAGLTCYLGTCLTDVEIEDYGKCKSDEDCAEESTLKTCLSNGKCGVYVNPGDLCDTTTYLCPEDYTCDLFCVIHKDEGEACDFNEHTSCDSRKGLYCINGYCRSYAQDQAIGEFCDPDYAYCQTGLTCQNHVCVEVKSENEACDPEANLVCPTGYACLNDICTPLGNACTQSADCTEKDSFCCLDDSCGAPGVCIPYDDNVTHDELCRYKSKPGIFEAQIQCRWQPTDIETNSKNVEMPPLVGHFGNSAGLETVVAVWSYSPTVIRFIHPETCETLESIKVGLATRWYNYPAAADFDGDGLMEFVTGTSSKTYLYKWDSTANDGKGGHVLAKSAAVDYRPMSLLYDIDNDGNTEIVGTFGSVIRVDKDTLDMEVLTTKDLFTDPFASTSGGYVNEAGEDAAIGNLDNDPEGIAELVTGQGLYTWNGSAKAWTKLLTFDWHTASGSSWVRQFAAYADFGTYDAENDTFDTSTLDGSPEIVISGKNKMSLYAIHKSESGEWIKKLVMRVDGFKLGGPITIGDFNNDGLPEIGIASQGLFGVYDPKCEAYEAGRCADKYVMWERWSQDNSSGTTGSSLFDFDGDGQSEAVYADECFTRVYDGKTGTVLFSAKRSSVTSIEGPVVADIDNDGSAEILMGSDSTQSCTNDTGKKYLPNATGNNAVDPIHEGIRCLDDEDCPLGTENSCNKTVGLCVCTSDDDCNTQYAPGKTTYLQQYICTAPIHPNVGFMANPSGGTSRSLVQKIGTRPEGWSEGDYKVCRATRKTMDIGVSDLMIFKDRLDRWVSSRNIWNQHAYNIINIEDDGKVPSATTWFKNWMLKNYNLKVGDTDAPRPMYNNYRLNKQGQYGAGMVPDITGRFIVGSICGTTEDNRHVISGKLCNRGTKPVAMNLPATFYYYSEDAPEHKGEKICTSYTSTPVGVGECAQVGCQIDDEAEFKALEGKKVLMISNIDENGFPSTVECNNDNNADVITIEKCAEDIVIVN